ncbi:MAG: elongation factor P [Bacteroidetes bacterium]|nr:elongation factor P [Bacteroidota bacterium]
MATTSDLKIGVYIRFNNELHIVEESQHRTPGNLRAFYQVKMRNIRNSKIVENRFRSGAEIDLARVERKEYQYLYNDGSNYYFMDQQSYEQIPIDNKLLGEGSKFLKESEVIEVLFDGSEPVGTILPFNVELKIVETIPGVKGDTATGATKPATTETGATINVPLFINEGDKIKVDTRTGKYLERVK